MAAMRTISGHFFRRYCRTFSICHPASAAPLQNFVPQCKCLHVSSYMAVKKTVTKKLPHPLDDVYLENLYEPVIYDLEKAITTLQRYMELDLADKGSIVRLNLDLHLAPKGKGKHQSFWSVSDPVHKFHYINKVCAFTEDADTIKQCLDNGAVYAGGHDAIQNVLYGKEQCDAFISTPQFQHTTLRTHSELAKAIGKLMPKKSKGISEDLIAELLTMRDGMLIHNQGSDDWKSSIVVGTIDQPALHIKENILHAMDVVRKQQNPKHPPIIKEGAVCCCEESLNFTVEHEEED